jgi:hypothetical protein
MRGYKAQKDRARPTSGAAAKNGGAAIDLTDPRFAPAAPDTTAHEGPTVVPESSFRRLRVVMALPGALMGLAMILTSAMTVGGRQVFSLFDDGLISMSFARTLADTGQLVWFPGAERVEGITNPLYTVVMALPHLMGLSDSHACLAISLFGLACAAATAYLAGGVAASLTGSRVAAAMTTLVVGCSFPLLFWSVMGLEVGALCLLAVALAALALGAHDRGFGLRQLAAMGAVMATGILVRQDFVVIAVVVAAACLLPPTSARSASRAVRAAMLGGAIGGALALVTGFRLSYYGEVVPNTYYLKMGDSSLLERLSRGIAVEWYAGAFLLVAAVALHRLVVSGGRRRAWGAGLLFAMAAAQTLYAMSTSGDFFVPDRFVVPVLVLSTIVIVSGAATVPGRIPAASATVAAGLICLAGVSVLPNGDGASPSLDTWMGFGTLLPGEDDTLNDADTLRRALAPTAVLGVTAAGAGTYWGHAPAIDLLGKMDSTIATSERRGPYGLTPGHDKWDYARSFGELKPDVAALDLLDPASGASTFWPPTPAERTSISRDYRRWCLPSGRGVMVRRGAEGLIDQTLLTFCPVTASPGAQTPDAAMSSSAAE